MSAMAVSLARHGCLLLPLELVDMATRLLTNTSVPGSPFSPNYRSLISGCLIPVCYDDLRRFDIVNYV